MGNVAENKQDSARAKVMRRARKAHLGETGSRVFNALIALVLCAGICMPDPTSLAYAREVALSAASGAGSAAGQAESGASDSGASASGEKGESSQEDASATESAGGSAGASSHATSNGNAGQTSEASAGDADAAAGSGNASDSQADAAASSGDASDGSTNKAAGSDSASDGNAGAAASSGNASDGQAGKAAGSSGASGGEKAGGPASSSASDAEDATDADDDADGQAGTLTQKVKFADGNSYTVQVEYDADAGILEGAELSVVQIIQKPSDEELAKKENKDRPYDTEKFASKANMGKRLDAVKKALDVEDDDYVFFAEYLDLSITADGKEVQPEAAVKVTVTTDAVSLDEAAAIELAALEYDADEKEFKAEAVDVLEVGRDKKKAEMGFELDALSEVAFVGVATPRIADTFHGQQVEVFAGRLLDASPKAAEVAGLADDRELLAAYAVDVERLADFDQESAAWVRVAAAEGAEPDDEGALSVYLVADDGTLGKRLAAQDDGAAAKIASGDSIAVVWEKSYRDTKLELGDVTVEGAMPADATGEAKDVAGEYADAAAVVAEAPEVVAVAQGDAQVTGDGDSASDAGADAAASADGAAAGVDANAVPAEDAAGPADPAADGDADPAAAALAAAGDGSTDIRTIAAYDISLQVAGADYQPGQDRPVTVSIRHDDISADKDLQVWHVLDDGTVEVITDFEINGDTVTFAATGFSTYMVVYTVGSYYRDAKGNTWRITAEYGPETGLPADVELKVRELDADEYGAYTEQTASALGTAAEAVSIQKAFDISFVKNGEEYHALKDDVRITVQLQDTEVSDAMSVVHMGETPERLEAAAAGDGISFASSAFSIFIIAKSELTRTYNFMNGADVYNKQVLKNGENLVQPPAPTRQGAVFRHWSLAEDGEAFTGFGAISIDADSLEGDTVEAKQAALDANPITLHAVYGTDHIYLTYYDQHGSVYQKQEIEKPSSGTNTVDTNEVSYTPIQDRGDAYLAFRYWSLGIADSNSGQIPQVGDNGVITVDSTTTDMDLYPVVAEGHWIYFDANRASVDNQSVTYTSPLFVINGDTSALTAGTPTTGGYKFLGWYTQKNGGDQVFDANGAKVENGYKKLLNKQGYLGNDPTLYAHWEPVDSVNYTVVIWRQKITDDKNAADEDKTYDFAETFTFTAKPGDTVTVGEGYTKLADANVYNGLHTDAPVSTWGDNPYYGFKYGRSDDGKKVKADGSAVLNVYYDRVLVRFTFKDFDNSDQDQSQYTEDATYGLINGNYVRLEKSGDSYYYWTYKTYNTTESNSGTQYAIDNRDSNGFKYSEIERKYSSGWKWFWKGTSTVVTGPRYTVASTGNLFTGSRYSYNSADNNYVQTAAISGRLYGYVNDAPVPLDRQTYTGTRYEVKIMSGLYGQTLTKYYSGWPSENIWRQSGSTEGGVTLWPSIPEFKWDILAIKYSNAGSSKIEYFLQDLNGNYPDTPELTMKYGPNTNVGLGATNDVFVGFHSAEYRTNPDGNWSDWQPMDYSKSEMLNQGLQVRFTRDKNSLIFMDSATGRAIDSIPEASVLYQDTLAGAKPAEDPTREGYEFTGWYYDEAGTSAPVDFEKDTMPAANLVVYAGWRVLRYEVNIDPNGGELGMPNNDYSTYFKLERGSLISEYSDVTRDYVKVAEGGTHVYRNYQRPDIDPDYQDYAGDKADNWQRRAVYKEIASLTDVDPQKDGEDIYISKPGAYTFLGWYKVKGDGTMENSPYNFNTPVTEDTTLKAKWRRSGGFTVVYNVGEASKAPKDEAEYIDGANAIVKNAVSAPKGKTLDYWTDKNGKQYKPNELLSVSEDLAAEQADGTMQITLTASYRDLIPNERYMADYVFMVPGDSGYETYYTQTIAAGEELVAPETPQTPASQAGKTFVGWYYDTAATRPFDGFGIVSSPVYTTLYAGFAETHTVTYYLANDDGTASDTVLAVQTYKDGDLLNTMGVEHPVDTDHDAVSWTDGTKSDYPYESLSNIKVTSDLALTAVIKAKQILYFDSQGGSYVDPVNIPEGGWPARPSEPTRTGYLFIGWYTQPDGQGDVYNFDKEPGELTSFLDPDKRTLYAKWELDTANPAQDALTIYWWVQTGDRPEDDAEDYEHYELVSGASVNLNDGTYTLETIEAWLAASGFDIWSTDRLAGLFDRYGQEKLPNYFEPNKTKSNQAVSVSDSGSNVLNLYFDRKEYTFVFNLTKARDGNKTSQNIASDGNTIHVGDNQYKNSDYSITVWLEKDVSKQWPIIAENRQTTNDMAWLDWKTDQFGFNGWYQEETDQKLITAVYFIDYSYIDKAVEQGLNPVEWGVTVRNTTNVTAAIHYIFDGVENAEYQQKMTLANKAQAKNDPNYYLKYNEGTDSEITYYTLINGKTFDGYEQITTPTATKEYNVNQSGTTSVRGRYVEAATGETKQETYWAYKYEFSDSKWKSVTFYNDVNKGLLGRITGGKDPITVSFASDWSEQEKNYRITYGSGISKTGGSIYYKDGNNWKEISYSQFVSDYIKELKEQRTRTVSVSGNHLYFYYKSKNYNLYLYNNDGSWFSGYSVTYKTQLSGDAGLLKSFVPAYQGEHPEAYEFEGWSTSASGFNQYLGQMPAHNLTLYASFKEKTFTVTTVGQTQDGAVTEDESVYGVFTGTYGQQLKELGIPNATSTGKIFKGWKNADTGATVSMNSALTGNLRIEPVWQEVTTYTLAYDLNNGNGEVPTDANRYMVGSRAVIKDGAGLTFERTDIDGVSYFGTFAYWSTNADGTGERYYAGSSMGITEASGDLANADGQITLYANYSAKRETALTYDLNVPGDDANPAKFVKADVPEGEDAVYVSDYLQVDGTIVLKFRDSSLSGDDNKQGIPNTQTTVGQDSDGTTFVPERAKYEFLGWSTDKDATEPMAQNGDKMFVNTLAEGGNTLYAVWGMKTLTLTKKWVNDKVKTAGADKSEGKTAITVQLTDGAEEPALVEAVQSAQTDAKVTVSDTDITLNKPDNATDDTWTWTIKIPKEAVGITETAMTGFIAEIGAFEAVANQAGSYTATITNTRSDVVCKVTDADHKLLYFKSGAKFVDAAFTSVYDAFYALANGNIYLEDKATKYTGASYVEMLVPKYEMSRIVNLKISNVTLTTASKNPVDGKYPYGGAADEPAVLTRKSNYNEQLFMPMQGSNFSLENITLDGGSRNVGYLGSLIYTYATTATNPTVVNLKSGTTLRNGWTTAAHGGAIDVELNCTLNMYDGVVIENCKADYYGGGVFVHETNSVFNMYGGTIDGCSARYGGGIGTIVGHGVINMSGGTIKNCKATTSGGGVNVNSHQVFNMSGGEITGCEAPKAGAVLVDHDGIFNMSGGEIKSNTTTGSGAVGAVSPDNATAKINFSGAPVIYDNKDSNGKQANVLLNFKYDTYKIINVVGEGLTGGKIGVWPTDAANQDEGEPFGVTVVKGANGNLGAFVNDYHSDHADKQFWLIGAPAANGTAGNVVWKLVICKIVDADGVEHPFTTLRSAVEYARAHKDTLPMDADHNVKIQMLVDYEIPKDDNVTLDKSTDNITITTAATSGGVYNFAPTFTSEQGRTDADDKATAILRRGWSGGSTDEQALFYINNANAKLTTQDIIFDGNSASFTGRAVYVKNGNLSIDGGSTFRNFSTPSNGGTIYLEKGGEFIHNTTDKGILFYQCKATSSTNQAGVAYCPNGCTMTVTNAGSGTVEFLECSAVGDGGALQPQDYANCTINNMGAGVIRFKDCTSRAGGAICTDYGTVTINNTSTGTVEFIGNTTNGSYGGGAVYCKNFEANNNNGTLRFQDCGFSSTKKDGGAVYATGGHVEIAGSGNLYVENCRASNGGGIYASQYVTIESTGTGEMKFTGCEASGNGGAIYAGGAVSVTASSAAAGEIAFLNSSASSNGGGVYGGGNVTATTANAAKPIRFENCTATSYYGGAIYQYGGSAMMLENVNFGSYQLDESGNPKKDDNGKPLVDAAKACQAKQAGGAVGYEPGSGKVTVKNCSFLGCKETGGRYGGGGLYVDSTAADSCLIEDSTFIDCESGKTGGAVQTKGGLTIVNGTITGCKASGANGGAVNVASGKMYFEGDVVVYDNKDASGNQKNVVLDRDDNKVINTTEAGLGAAAKIGVYVTGDQASETSIYGRHGDSGDPFGTRANDDHNDTLENFINDINGLFATKGDTAMQIIWMPPIKAYTYVNMTGLKDNTEFMEMLGIKYYNDVWAPGGVVEIPSSILTGKDDYKTHVDGVKGRGLITSRENPDDWDTVIKAIKDTLDPTQLSETGWGPNAEGLYPAANKDNTLKDHAGEVLKYYGYNGGSGLFYFDSDDHYLYKSEEEGGEDIRFHLDLTFNTTKVKFVYGTNGMDTDGKDLETRTYILNSVAPEPISLNKFVPADYAIEGYYSSADFGSADTKRWQPWAENPGKRLKWWNDDGNDGYLQEDGWKWENVGTTENPIYQLTVYVKLRKPSYAFLSNRSSNDYMYRLYVDGGNYAPETLPEYKVDDTTSIKRGVIKRGSENQDPEFKKGAPYKDEHGYYYEFDMKKNSAETLYLPGASGLGYQVRVFKATESGGGTTYAEVTSLASENIKLNGEEYTVTEGGSAKTVYKSDPIAGGPLPDARTYVVYGSDGTQHTVYTAVVDKANYDKSNQDNCYNQVMTASPAEVVKVVIVDEGFDVSFKKVNGFGEALPGAAFTIYSDPECTTSKQRGSDSLTGVSSDGTDAYKDSDGNTLASGAVYIPKVPTGVWYMMERTVDGASGAPDGYEENTKRYVVLVGTTALKAPADGEARTGAWEAGGVLERITQADIGAQTGADGKFAIFQLDESGQAIATPDIGAFGIANNAGSGKVMLRKTDGTDYTALEGARFRIFSYSMEEITEGRPTDDSGNRLDYYESTENGVYFIGTLPIGRYYLVEMQPPTKVNGTGTAAYDGNTGKVFTLDVTADGAPKQVDTNQKIDLADMPASLKAWAAGEA